MTKDHKRKRGTSSTEGSTCTDSSKISSESNRNRQKKKKKRLSKEELHNEEAEAKYSKLVHVSAKNIRKESKLCKAFECQKIVRKIKALKVSSSDISTVEGVVGDTEDVGDSKEAVIIPNKTEAEEGNCTGANSKVERKIKNLEVRLRLMRAFDLEELVNTCLTRLGLDFTKASQKGAIDGVRKKAKVDDKINENGQCTSENETDEKENMTSENQQYYKSLTESMLRHKKMVAAIESVNASVSEYNKWLAKREDWLYRSSNKGKHNKKSKDRMRNNYGDSGLFINSLAGEEINHEDEDNDSDGYQDYDDNIDIAPKRNRMGQRARKARAVALEAKREGKPYNLSNKKWWEMKAKNPKKEQETNTYELASGLDVSKQVAVAEVVEMGSNWKEDGKAHPSWAARQVQKAKSGSGIGDIEFKGKKITFD